MDKPLFYRINVWIAEELKDYAPNLYKYKKQFGDSGSATVEMFWKAGLIAFADFPESIHAGYRRYCH